MRTSNAQMKLRPPMGCQSERRKTCKTAISGPIAKTISTKAMPPSRSRNCTSKGYDNDRADNQWQRRCSSEVGALSGCLRLAAQSEVDGDTDVHVQRHQRRDE